MTTTEVHSRSGSSAAAGPSGLVQWWERFKKRGAPKEEGVERAGNRPDGIFQVPLYKSIKYANVAISLTDANGEQFIYGYIPIVVAKCGVFLKEKATDVEGIFRLNGSEKRIAALVHVFDSPDTYGKGLNWDGYNVHDAANVLRRYINKLPEPIVPSDFYEPFLEPLEAFHSAPKEFDHDEAIRKYQRLISQLPPLNRQLLLYLLDLLAVFASKSEQNHMTASNLSVIFQPGIIHSPRHDLTPEAYKLAQDVLVFLITHQDHFLLGMRGSNDQRPPHQEMPMSPATPPRRTRPLVNRSPSNASAGADDVRKNGGLRRNVSVTSRKSAGSPVIGSGGGLSRSNTLPSKRSSGQQASALKGDGPSTPTSSTRSRIQTPLLGRSPSIGGQMVENVVPANPLTPIGPPKQARSAILPQSPSPGTRSPEEIRRIASPPAPARPVTPPHRDGKFAGFFALSPESGLRQPNKLKKKRIPGSNNNSAESSTTSLPGSNFPGSTNLPTSSPPLETVPQSPPIQMRAIPVRSRNNMASSGASAATLMPAMSPTPSAASSVTSQSSSHSYSDHSTSPPKKKEARRRWRLSSVGNHDFEKPLTSPTFQNASSSNGSIMETLRRASKSPPPPDYRRTSNDGAITSGDEESKGSWRRLGFLAKRSNEKKNNYQQLEDSERETERKKSEDMHVHATHHPLLPPIQQAPGSLLVQSPTPSSHVQPIPENEAEPRELKPELQPPSNHILQQAFHPEQLLPTDHHHHHHHHHHPHHPHHRSNPNSNETLKPDQQQRQHVDEVPHVASPPKVNEEASEKTTTAPTVAAVAAVAAAAAAAVVGPSKTIEPKELLLKTQSTTTTTTPQLQLQHEPKQRTAEALEITECANSIPNPNPTPATTSTTTSTTIPDTTR